MTYPILDPPTETSFRDMTATELSSYKTWFLAHLSAVDTLLARAMGATTNFQTWMPTLQRQSLNSLGEWMYLKIRGESGSHDVVQIQFQLRGQTVTQRDPLTAEAFSLAADAGIYLAKTLAADCSGLSWRQQLGRKSDIDYGKMVLSGFKGGLVFEPIRMGVVLAHGMLRGRKSEAGLASLFDYWSDLVLETRH